MRAALQKRLGQAAPVVTLALSLCATPVAMALDLVFPGPTEMTASRAEPMTSLTLPVGPFAAGQLPGERIEGALSMSAYRVALTRGSTLDLMRALEQQVVAAGFSPLFFCQTEICGGYDFRYGMQVLPEPDMHVDLADFRYLAAKGPNGAYLALLVSRAGDIGFVQVTQIGGTAGLAVTGAAMPTLTAPSPADVPVPIVDAPPGPAQPMGIQPDGLESGRTLVLEDLVFPSGSSTLAAGDYASLAGLASWLTADPTRKVVLVGHTDASGGLESNIRLSKSRAESVRQNLLSAYKVAPGQIQAEGVGSLAPRDTNLTEGGRRNNRRVEVMVTSTDLLAP